MANKVHALKIGSQHAACGIIGTFKNAFTKQAVNCNKCRKTEEWRSLPSVRSKNENHN